MIASELIRRNTTEYGASIIDNHFPNPIDGFKVVKRRILFTIKNPDKEFSGLELISNTIRIHPYGDSSIYDTGTRMTDMFRSTFPLLNSQNKGNAYNGGVAASARYSKFTASDFYKEVFINGVNMTTIPTEITEDLSGKEIAYFIPKIPTALLYSNESVGFGYSSRTLPLMLENICDIVCDYVKSKSDWNYKSVVSKFIPKLPIRVYIKNRDNLISEYKNGRFDSPVETEGVYILCSNNSVMFRTLAYGISPAAIKSNLIKQLKDPDSWLSTIGGTLDTLSEDTNYIDFRITVKRGSNIFEVIDRLNGIVRFRSVVHPIHNFTYKKKMINLDPPGVIKLWYTERYRSILGAKKHRQQELQLIKMRLDTYLIICGHVDEVINIIRTNDIEDIYKKLAARFELSKRQCEILLSADLRTLMKARRDDLESKSLKITADIAEINDSFNKIDVEITDELVKIRRKYRTRTEFVSTISEYIGCLIIDNLGIIQLNDISDITTISNMFQKNSLKFIRYDKGVNQIKLSRNSIYSNVESLPYTTSNSSIGTNYPSKPILFIRGSDDRIRLIDQTKSVYLMSVLDVHTNYVSKSGYIINKHGTISPMNDRYLTTSRSLRDVLYVFDRVADELIIISVNSSDITTVRLQRLVGRSKVRLSMAGDTTILGVYAVDVDTAVVQLPSWHKNRIMMISDPILYLKNNNLVDIPISRIEKV